jgi:predicted TIM-barrel fold metal-dependent hydrolase
MTSPLVSARIPHVQGVGLACNRTLDGAGAKLPEGTIIVSSDNHWGLAEDPWKGRVPAHLADRMPSIWWDEAQQMFNMGFCGEPLFNGYVAKVLKAVEDRPGTSRIEERMRDLDAEGIAMELVFPQTLLMFFKFPDTEVREWLFRAYNEYLAEVGARAPGRFFGVGFINFWDVAKIEESIQHLKGCGLKAFCIPINPGNDIDGNPIEYASEKMDILWATAAALGLPIYFHVGETLNFEGPGGVVANSFEIFAPFRKNFAQLVFGGIFDRHPNLRVIFAEAGLHWVPGVLQDAELMMDQFEELLDPKLKLRPTDYWRRNCYATFMADSLGLKLLDYIGADRVLWAADYPHMESTAGITRSVIDEIVASVSEADAKKILGGNAIELFDLV